MFVQFSESSPFAIDIDNEITGRKEEGGYEVWVDTAGADGGQMPGMRRISNIESRIFSKTLNFPRR